MLHMRTYNLLGRAAPFMSQEDSCHPFEASENLQIHAQQAAFTPTCRLRLFDKQQTQSRR